MPLLKSWYPHNSSDTLPFVRNWVPTREIITVRPVAPSANSPASSNPDGIFFGRLPLPSQFHALAKQLLLCGCFLSSIPPWRTQPLPRAFWITVLFNVCPTLPSSLSGGWDPGGGIMRNQDSDCKKSQTNWDKISFYPEAKGWTGWTHVPGCKNYDAFRQHNFQTFRILSEEPLRI